MISETTVKNNIREVRERMGLSQAKMAEMIGISVTAYRKIETGKTAVIGRSLYSISEQSGVPIEKIILGYDPVDPSDRSWHGGADLESEIVTLKSYYEAKLKEKADEIAGKDLVIVDLRSDIKRLEAFAASQQKMIDFLQKHTNL